MELMGFSLYEFLVFFLVFVRMGAFFFTAPVFGSQLLPPPFKVGLSFAVSMLAFSAIDPRLVFIPDNIWALLPLVLQEMVVGILLGFALRLVMAAVEMAGTFIGLQMGFGLANILDPLNQDQVSIMAQLYNAFGVLIFLSINAHHLFVLAIVKTYQFIPVGGGHFGGSVVAIVSQMTVGMFTLAFQLGAPLIVSMLLASVGLGLMARTVPQMNVFLLAFPINIGVGMLILAFSFPMFYSRFKSAFDQVWEQLFRLMHTLG